MVRMHHLRRDENKKVHTFNIVVVVHGIPSLQLHLSVGFFTESVYFFSKIALQIHTINNKHNSVQHNF